MTAALRREQITFPGAGMTLDWIPGAGLAVAGGALSLWRSAVMTEEKVRGLKEEITRVESDSRAFQNSIHAEFHETLEKLNNVVTQMLVNIARQSEFNRACTKTMESINARVENHDVIMMKNHTDIELLKAAGKQS